MDTKLYHLSADLSLTARSSDSDPEIRVMLNDDILYHGQFSGSQVFTIDRQLPGGPYQLSVELLNKHALDMTQAVIIDYVSFNNIKDAKFAWSGEYCPNYPEPWYSEQLVKPEPLLKNHTYLGWNGKWTLTFTIPVFTWIHKTQNLGWIYN